MILEIPALVRKLAPDLFKGSDLPGVICVRTTRPKYLVFNKDPDRPACIAQFGVKDELEQLHRILSLLHSKEPDLVAEPLVLAPWRDNMYVHLQAGLPGTPWFRIANKYRSQQDWTHLVSMGNKALDRFHVAVSSFPEWSSLIRPGDELRSQTRICKEQGVPLSNMTQDCVARYAEHLDDLGQMVCFWQHGDFCLNNLLVNHLNAAVIDFEEFGGTAMPLHDQIGLYLSFCEMAPPNSLSPTLLSSDHTGLRCREGVFVQKHLLGLYIHHLLRRINQCQERPTRAQVKVSLLERLDKIVRFGMGSTFGSAHLRGTLKINSL